MSQFWTHMQILLFSLFAFLCRLQGSHSVCTCSSCGLGQSGAQRNAHGLLDLPSPSPLHKSSSYTNDTHYTRHPPSCISYATSIRNDCSRNSLSQVSQLWQLNFCDRIKNFPINYRDCNLRSVLCFDSVSAALSEFTSSVFFSKHKDSQVFKILWEDILKITKNWG